MIDATADQRPPHKVPLKLHRARIIDIIRANLNIPEDIPRGGPVLHSYLKKIELKRLRMAMELAKPYYDQFFQGEFTTQKLYRWVDSNEKIHKGSLIQSDEIRSLIYEKLQQDCPRKRLEVELASVLRQHDPNFKKSRVSKSSIMRFGKDFRSQDYKQGYKKIKVDTNQEKGVLPDYSTVQSLSFEDELSQEISVFNSPESWSDLDLDSLMETASKSMELLLQLPECMKAINFMHTTFIAQNETL